MKSINGNRSGQILACEEARAADKITIEKLGINSGILMGWAGQAAFHFCSSKKFFRKIEKIFIFCGPGNNGGDGYVFAWHALVSTEKKLTIVQTSRPYTPDAAYYFERIAVLKESAQFYDRLEIIQSNELNNKDFTNLKRALFIDAVLGTGLTRPLDQQIAQLASLYNNANAKKISLDIPTGLSSDGNSLPGPHFKSNYTLALSQLKIGHVTEPGIAACGKIYVLPIGIPAIQQSCTRRLSDNKKLPALRKPEGHKYLSGTVHILGGSKGYEGAALMAGQSFLATGGGIVRIFSSSPNITRILQDSPELMIQSAKPFKKLCSAFIGSLEKMKDPGCVIIGPGLSHNVTGEFLSQLLACSLRGIILDGGILRQLAGYEELFRSRNTATYVLMTPHRGEAEALLGKKITNVYQAAREIRDRYRTAVYLKGPGGILLSENKSHDEIFFASQNFGLATAGTGDVLTGFLGSGLCRASEPILLAESAISAYLDAANSIQNADKTFREDGLTASLLYKFRAIKRGKS